MTRDGSTITLQQGLRRSRLLLAGITAVGLVALAGSLFVRGFAHAALGAVGLLLTVTGALLIVAFLVEQLRGRQPKTDEEYRQRLIDTRARAHARSNAPTTRAIRVIGYAAAAVLIATSAVQGRRTAVIVWSVVLVATVGLQLGNRLLRARADPTPPTAATAPDGPLAVESND